MRRRDYIWMAVTPDEYELPLAVADTANELEQMLGLNKGAIRRYDQCTGRYSGRRIVRVKKGEDDEI